MRVNPPDIALVIRYGNHEYELLAPARYWFTYRGRFLILSVPEGFSTDLASLPSLAGLFGITNADPRLVAPAILHDFLYRTGGVAAQTERGDAVVLRLTRKEKDRIFLQKMRDFGFPRLRALLVYLAVRLFGFL